MTNVHHPGHISNHQSTDERMLGKLVNCNFFLIKLFPEFQNSYLLIFLNSKPLLPKLSCTNVGLRWNVRQSLFFFSIFSLHIILLILRLQLSHFFLRFIPFCPVLLPRGPLAFSYLSSCPGVTYKFCAFYISHSILNLTLSILYLPFMLLIPCTFSPILSPPPPCW